MIIGLSGYARSGKDTVANILVERYGYKRVAFADPIRDLLYDVDPFVDRNISLKSLVDEYGWDVAKSYPEVRRLMQDLGLSARRLFGESFWLHQATKSFATSDKVVVADVRFVNEADTLRQNGGQVWRVERPGTEAVNEHISEHALANYNFDNVITNSSSLEDLELLIKIRMQGVGQTV
jgi:hypothetical protein